LDDRSVRVTVELIAGVKEDALKSATGGDVVLWQLIVAVHPVDIVFPSDVNLNVSAPAAFDAVTVPGPVIPS
jgi:hypothetical protein